MLPADSVIIKQARYWVDAVIIDHNFCPFARREVLRDSIHYSVVRAADLNTVLESLRQHYQALDADPSRETSLLIFPDRFTGFDDYLDMVDAAEQDLLDAGYEGIYQLASFHPDYQFAGSAVDDPANYTNRFLYPMLHIIREASIARVLEHVDHPEEIPERNIAHARDKGQDFWQQLLQSCAAIRA